MKLLFGNHIQIANKWLILLSGITKQAVKINGKLVYEKHYFHISEEWAKVKWSKTMIKQVLAYLGLADSKGVVGLVDLEELAQVLNCSVRSLRNINKLLTELNLVEVNELYGSLVHISLINYLPNFLDLHNKNNKQDEYTSYTGYTTIKREALFDLFEIENINILRIACRALYLQEKEVNLAGNTSILLSSEMLKGFLPKYFTYRPVIERAISILEDVFAVHIYSLKTDKKSFLSEFNTNTSLIEKLTAPYIISLKMNPIKDSRITGKDELSDLSINLQWNKDVRAATCDYAVEALDSNSLSELVYEYSKNAVKQALNDIVSWFAERYEDLSEIAFKSADDFDKFRWSDNPIPTIRSIFYKYALSLQEGYLTK